MESFHYIINYPLLHNFPFFSTVTLVYLIQTISILPNYHFHHVDVWDNLQHIILLYQNRTELELKLQQCQQYLDSSEINLKWKALEEEIFHFESHHLLPFRDGLKALLPSKNFPELIHEFELGLSKLSSDSEESSDALAMKINQFFLELMETNTMFPASTYKELISLSKELEMLSSKKNPLTLLAKRNLHFARRENEPCFPQSFNISMVQEFQTLFSEADYLGLLLFQDKVSWRFDYTSYKDELKSVYAKILQEYEKSGASFRQYSEWMKWNTAIVNKLSGKLNGKVDFYRNAWNKMRIKFLNLTEEIDMYRNDLNIW